MAFSSFLRPIAQRVNQDSYQMDTSPSPVTPGGGFSCFQEKAIESSGFLSACSFASTVRPTPTPTLTPAPIRDGWSCLPYNPRASSVFASSPRASSVFASSPRASSVFASSLGSLSANFLPLDEGGARSAPVGFNCNSRELADLEKDAEEVLDIRKKFSRREASPRGSISEEDFSGEAEILSIIGNRFFSDRGLEEPAGHSSENPWVCDVDEPASRPGSMEPSEVCALVVSPVWRGTASEEPTLSDLMANNKRKRAQEDFALNGRACDVDGPAFSPSSMDASEVSALVEPPVWREPASEEPTLSDLMANNKRNRAQ